MCRVNKDRRGGDVLHPRRVVYVVTAEAREEAPTRSPPFGAARRPAARGAGGEGGVVWRWWFLSRVVDARRQDSLTQATLILMRRRVMIFCEPGAAHVLRGAF